MRRSDLISGSVLALFGLVMIFGVVPYQIDSGGDYGLDPKFFPVSLLWLIVVMSAMLVASRIPVPADPVDVAPPLDRRDWIFIAGASAFLALGFVAIERLGFMIAGVLIIAVLMYVMGVRREWLRLAGVSIGAPIFIYLALKHLFSIQLP
jgi:hypothetical protein